MCNDRQNIFDYYSGYSDPLFNITAEVDITNLKQFASKTDNSFFLLNLYASLSAVNYTAAFSFRVKEGKVDTLEVVNGGSTFLRENNKFGFFYFNYYPDLQEFLLEATERMQAARDRDDFSPEDSRIDLVHFSTIPWIRFTGFKNARASADLDQVPKIVFGKYAIINGRWTMPVSIEIHHGLVDGFHVGLFLDKYQSVLDQFV
jgi:chloramphenicol O-acetyltransferase type A